MDFLESIRSFDPESQRSFEKIESVTLAGSFEQGGESTSDIFEYLEGPIIIASSFELNNIFRIQESPLKIHFHGKLQKVGVGLSLEIV